jgi:CrcB protein
MSFSTCIIVMAGGALGTLARYVVSVLMLPFSKELPWGTILINVSGSFLIGLFGTLTLATGRYPVPENLRMFVMIGFCGGYTTFSSFSLQTLDLLRAGAFGRASVNVAGSVIVCILAVVAGHAIASYFNSGEPKIAQIAIEEDA